ncbi:hypothetical protein BDV96DRAFT_677116 [Lophiotrema nucula]|uniref:Uncharacterized protein n=1 Tax=Lophiotrema nucula TaxID=690887 RepID=A0A6A5YEH0_9PLEO|nr:hypothetical protein BDV96DRAFT_677116 [Lophiotrema nucula]
MADGIAQPCTFTGNSDLYGLGIRLGVYLQWIASIFAYNCSPAETSSMRGVNTCFQLATAIGLIVMMAQPHDNILALEVFLLLILALGASCDYCTRPAPKVSEWHIRISPLIEALGANTIGDLIRMTVAAAVCACGSWYAFTGLDRLGRRPCGDFGFVFVFAKVPLDSGYRSFLKAIFLVSLCLFFAITLLSGYLIYGRFIEIWRTWGLDRGGEQDQAGKIKPSGAKIFLAMALWSFFVLTVELTLRWNEVTGVYECRSFSQLFPLIIASANLFRLALKIGTDIWRGNVTIV